MKERPILMSAPMVRAILEGRKSQTRRIVKPQPTLGSPLPAAAASGNWTWSRRGGFSFTVSNSPSGPSDIAEDCPYGAPGDRLWVREKWGYKAQFFEHDAPNGGDVVYGADGEPEGCHGTAWRPSIHMPRNLCRITLEVTGVRVERLQDIGKDGHKAASVLAEGITTDEIEHYRKFFHPNDCPALAFAALWEAINGAGSWAANPFVWVIEFKRLEQA